MLARYLYYFILFTDTLVLLVQTQNLSISFSEASLLYEKNSFLQSVINFSFSLFGQNDLSLRFPMIIFHLSSIILIYEIAKEYIPKSRDRTWFIFIFVLLPGVISSAVIVNSAGLVIFGLLLFLYLYKKVSLFYVNVLLLFYAIIDIGFSYLFLGLITYYVTQRKNYLALYTLLLYLINSYLFGFDASGSPAGHFLDTIGVYSAIFTPIIFIYLVYALYRTYLTSKLDILWYIATVALIVSLVLSFRQRVAVEHFAPYLIVALPIAAKLFIHSYRVRLKIFRMKYKLAFVISIIFLILNAFIVFFNQELYTVLEKPKQHFAYKMHIAKELSLELKKYGVSCVNTDKKMQKRLLFYEISKCVEHTLIEVPLNRSTSDVTVRYKDKVLYRANVTNINSI